jgi:hypothetical protein
VSAAEARAFVRAHPDSPSSLPPRLCAEALHLLKTAGFPCRPASGSDREARERAARLRAADACDLAGGL